MDDFLDDELLPPDAGTVMDEMDDTLDQDDARRVRARGQSRSRMAARRPTPRARTTSWRNKTALVFKSLLEVFAHSTQNTHRSKYPQILLFYRCAMDPQLKDVFISQLLSAALDA